VEKEDPEFKEWEDDLIDGRKKRLRLRAPRHKGKWLWMYKMCLKKIGSLGSLGESIAENGNTRRDSGVESC